MGMNCHEGTKLLKGDYRILRKGILHYFHLVNDVTGRAAEGEHYFQVQGPIPAHHDWQDRLYC